MLKKLKGVLTGFVAVVFAAGLAGAANLSIISGPQDPSQLLATINTLVQSINSGVSGRLAAFITDTGTTTTAGDSAMFTYTMPASTLAAAGDSVRVSCWGTSATNSNAKTVKLFFGNQFVSTANASVNAAQFSAQKWRLSLTVMRSGAATQVVMGDGAVGATQVAVYTAAGTETNASAITIKCSSFTPTATQDVTAQGMLVEQVK